MTDEQVDRIVQALQGGDPWWVPLLLTTFGAIIGFGLSQLQELLTRRRTAKEQSEAHTRSLINEVKRLALDFATMKGETVVSDRNSATASMNALFTPLLAMNREAGYWAMRQLQRLLQPPANGTSWTRDEVAKRANIGSAIGIRLDMWTAGAVEEEDFKPEHDAEWDEGIRNKTAFDDARKKWIERRRRP